MTIQRPYHLTESKAKNPHRRLSEKYGRMSILESSFARKDMEEIQYWMLTGVVDEAMSGKANSRIPYSKNLLDLFAENVGTGYDVRINAKHLEIIQLLWDKGASKHTDCYDRWLALLSTCDFAHTLLDAGAHPWGEKPLTLKKDKPFLYGPPHEVRNPWNAVEVSLGNLMALEQSLLRGKEENRLNLEKQHKKRWEVFDRMFTMPGANAANLRRILGFVTFGGIQAHGSVYAEKWEKLRDQLLDMGAEICLTDMDGLSCLINSSPHTPYNEWEMTTRVNEYIKEFQSSNPIVIHRNGYSIPGLVSEEQKAEFVNAEIQRRASQWASAANDWLEVFEVQIKEQSKTRDTSFDSIRPRAASLETLEKLFDVPGGEKLFRRITGILLDAGYSVPWQPGHNSTQEWSRFSHNGDFVKTPEGYRSYRKLLAWMDIINDPKLGSNGICQRWRCDTAHHYLLARPTKPQDDKPAGGTVESWGRKKLYFGLLASSFKYQLATVDELSTLIDLAGPEIIGSGGPDQWKHESFNWLATYITQLPWLWVENKIRPTEQNKTITLLLERNIFEFVLDELKILDNDAKDAEIQDPADRAQALANFNLTGMSRWFDTTSAGDTLIRALDKKKPNLAHRMKMLRAYYIASRVDYESNGEVFPDPGLEKEFASNGKAIQLAGDAIALRLESLRSSYQSYDCTGIWLSVKHMMALGWKPQDPVNFGKKITQNITNYLIGSPHTPSEKAQSILFDIILGLEYPASKCIVDIVQAIFNHDKRPNNMMGWAPFINRAVEETDQIDSFDVNDLGQRTELGEFLSIAVQKKSLIGVARQAVQKAGGELDLNTPRPRPKF